jgi:hypothetical protein
MMHKGDRTQGCFNGSLIRQHLIFSCIARVSITYFLGNKFKTLAKTYQGYGNINIIKRCEYLTRKLSNSNPSKHYMGLISSLLFFT